MCARHGMRMLVQATLIGSAAAIAWGDFSSVLATAPVLPEEHREQHQHDGPTGNTGRA
jgi:hypothetical protein